MDVRRIAAGETLDLRRRILRPRLPPEESRYRGDDDPESGHFGAFEAGALVGVASVLPEAEPGRAEPAPSPAETSGSHVSFGNALPGAWRLRGVAVEPAWRGRGVGVALVGAARGHAKERGATAIWFLSNARAVRFYERLGFAASGPERTLPNVGPIVPMRGAP